MNNTTKRNYVGHRVVMNAVLDYLQADGTVGMTACEIAKAHGLNPMSVRMAARKLKVTLKRGAWGGRRTPANGHVKNSLTLGSDNATKTP